jgi:hypothetical protein
MKLQLPLLHFLSLCTFGFGHLFPDAIPAAQVAQAGNSAVSLEAWSDDSGCFTSGDLLGYDMAPH